MFTKISSRSKVLWAAVSLTLLLGAASAAFAQLRISSNPHYFKNGTTVIPLVGYSAEYLPHIIRPTKKNDYATLDSPYTAYIDELKARGLNLMQIWVDLNHSIGLKVDANTIDCNGLNDGVVKPYCNEQPFFWNGQRWRLDRAETGFYTNLKNVIAYAASKGVFVEVTLFDPWQAVEFDSSHPAGFSPTSPWSVGKNLWYDGSGTKHTDAHFQETRFFVSFDHGTTDTDPVNVDARALQVKLVQEIVAQLNPYTNFYWEIANEPDFNPRAANPPLDICAMVRWHNSIAQVIAQAESAPGLNKHEIGVNFITKEAMDTVQSGQCGTPPVALPLDPNIKIVNGHYVNVTPTAQGVSRFGAITAGRTYNSTSTPINKLFGFNETWESPTASNRMSARAGAWEHMLSEGGLYDHYALSWNNPDERAKPCSDASISSIATQVRCDLGKLNSFLAQLTLVSMVRQTGAKPSWITSGVVDYGTPDWPGSNTYWGAMQVTGSQYAFYYHHSTISTDSRSKRYVPVQGSYQRNFTFNLAGAATGYYYKLEWFYYSPATPHLQSKSTDSLLWNGSAVSKPTPVYNYDLALRLTRCPTLGLNC
jgi:hypothetical protein